MNQLVKNEMIAENSALEDSRGCFIVPEITSQDVIDFRLHMRVTQEEFAKLYDIPLATLRNWEQKRSSPLISKTRLFFYNKLFDEKAKILAHVVAPTIKKAA